MSKCTKIRGCSQPVARGMHPSTPCPRPPSSKSRAASSSSRIWTRSFIPPPVSPKGRWSITTSASRPVLVPHLAGRPLTMKRYPGGVNEEFFFEKNAPKHRPDWVKTAPVWSEGNNRTMYYILANDLPTLVWIANLASIELHPSLSLGADIETPTMIVFDLDPGPPANIVQCCQVGLWVRDIFAHFGLQSFAKTSGSKGLQIYVPLHTKTSYERNQAVCPRDRAPARAGASRPGCLRYEKGDSHEQGFVDWSQNDQHKTTISVYSLRAREHPTVSTPVTWEEVEQALKKKDAARLVFEAKDVLARVEKMGDLFEPVLKLKQKLPQLSGLTAAAEKEDGEGVSAGLRPRRARAQRRKPRPKGSQSRPSAASYNRALYGASLRGHFRMGVSDVEARFLSGETGAEEIPELLRLPTECRRSQLHLPPTGKRNDRPELDRGNARAFSLQHQGAPGAHAHQAPEECGRIPAALSRHTGRIGARRASRPAALSAAAEFQGRSGRALRVPEKSAAKCADGLRVPERILVLRRRPGTRCASAISRSAWRKAKLATLPTLSQPTTSTTATASRRTLSEEREKMVARMREHLAAGRDVFAYFKHEETPEGALYALDILRSVESPIDRMR